MREKMTADAVRLCLHTSGLSIKTALLSITSLIVPSIVLAERYSRTDSFSNWHQRNSTDTLPTDPHRHRAGKIKGDFIRGVAE